MEEWIYYNFKYFLSLWEFSQNSTFLDIGISICYLDKSVSDRTEYIGRLEWKRRDMAISWLDDKKVLLLPKL